MNVLQRAGNNIKWSAKISNCQQLHIKRIEGVQKYHTVTVNNYILKGLKECKDIKL